MAEIHFDIFCIFTFGALGLESPRGGAMGNIREFFLLLAQAALLS